MSVAQKLANHLRHVYVGGNWTDVSLRDVLSDVDVVETTTQVSDFNTIARLVYHIKYFISAALPVLRGGELDAHDRLSFDVGVCTTEEQWQELVSTARANALSMADVIETLSDEDLDGPFADTKYGTVYRNLAGILEHTHYHLGPIVLLKKIIREHR